MSDACLLTELESRLISHGLTFLASADLTPLPPAARQDLPVGICLGVRLDPGVVSQIADGPTRAYAAHYRSVNRLLDELAQLGAQFLGERGFRAVASPATGPVHEETDLSTPLPHKTVATRAGVGWIGKCALLITESYGSAVRYNTVLTDAPLPLGTPVDRSYCGDCTACVEACPAGAPSGTEWRLGLARAEFFDAYSCRRMAQAQAADVGIEHPICGICIAACPHTQRYLRWSSETSASC
jgi:epoxyqueuosine reductase